ncbi:hypothetical protein WJX75_006844 [Coccomyxa subellipsoidea]|uniref:AP2/ERF domain-containing protein n=1 Tax=Coccomyxa subellipsoidea TaxID=248742 RepID=A0ABR2YBL1_9CHLO
MKLWMQARKGVIFVLISSERLHGIFSSPTSPLGVTEVSVAGDISAPGNDVEGCFEFADSFGEADISHYEDFPAVASAEGAADKLKALRTLALEDSLNPRLSPSKRRRCTPAGPGFSTRHFGSKIIKGVRWHKNLHAWRATISIGGETRHLRDFGSEEEAAQAYYEEQVRLFNIAMVRFRQSRTEDSAGQQRCVCLCTVCRAAEKTEA